MMFYLFALMEKMREGKGKKKINACRKELRDEKREDGDERVQEQVFAESHAKRIFQQCRDELILVYRTTWGYPLYYY